ncbi:hypothetical protein M5K25_022166 [Dendrobium thyrsiflorum]|uniref:Uncharacterized protein n=1 Tax=Dendrobium thyrsiflorum TaxID=117978 RepID=A0ABD0U5W2_DENTH
MMYLHGAGEPRVQQGEVAPKDISEFQKEVYELRFVSAMHWLRLHVWAMALKRSKDEDYDLPVNGRFLNVIDKDESDEYPETNAIGHSYYPEDLYSEEDGQLSWFNAGVRVGVGIGLGMCIGIGIGAGLLMRSYQATTRGFRRRFF